MPADGEAGILGSLPGWRLWSRKHCPFPPRSGAFDSSLLVFVLPYRSNLHFSINKSGPSRFLNPVLPTKLPLRLTFLSQVSPCPAIPSLLSDLSSLASPPTDSQPPSTTQAISISPFHFPHCLLALFLQAPQISWLVSLSWG